MCSCSSCRANNWRGPRFSAAARLWVLLLASAVITGAHRPKEQDCDGTHGLCNEGSLQAESQSWSLSSKEPEDPTGRPDEKASAAQHASTEQVGAGGKNVENPSGSPDEKTRAAQQTSTENVADSSKNMENPSGSPDEKTRAAQQTSTENVADSSKNMENPSGSPDEKTPAAKHTSAENVAGSGKNVDNHDPQDCGPLSRQDDVKAIDRKKVVDTFPDVLCKFEADVLADLKKPILEGGSRNGECPIEDFMSGGYGCAFYPDSRSNLEVEDEDEPACSCLKSQFQFCWSPDIDEFLAAVAKGDNSSSIEVGKAFLVGKCHTPVYVWITMGVLATCIVICFLLACFKKPKSADPSKDPRLAGSTRDPRKAGNQGS